MSSKKEILRMQNGVRLLKISVLTEAMPIVAYSVSTKRTPEVWQSTNLIEAHRLFEQEVGRCQDVSV